MIQCREAGCPAVFDGFMSPSAVGWHEWDEEAFCPLHGPGEAFRRQREAQDAELLVRQEARIRFRNEQTARAGLMSRDYHAWDQFQQDIANFHRKTGKQAPKQLRTMGPRDFMRYYAKNGRIDVQRESELAEGAEKQGDDRLRGWLR